MSASLAVALMLSVLRGPAPNGVIWHGPRDQNKIALTFDACSTRTPEYDERITRTLLEAGVPATIFVGGRWARDEAAHVRALAASPCSRSAIIPTPTRISRNWSATARFATSSSARRSRSSRSPARSRRCCARPMANTTIGWCASRPAWACGRSCTDVASGDPGRHVTKDALVHWVLRQARPGSIVVMHINHLRFHTAEALPEIIAGLRARGFSFVTVSQLERPAVASRGPVGTAAAMVPVEVRP
jgi:peptidoglycan/xylan/chitin deacetylase (PgdA/CDA1 family)